MKKLYDKYDVVDDHRIEHKLYIGRSKWIYYRRIKRVHYIKIHIIILGLSYSYEKCYWNWSEWPLLDD